MKRKKNSTSGLLGVSTNVNNKTSHRHQLGHYNYRPFFYSKELIKETMEATATMAAIEVAILTLAADLAQWSWLYLAKSWGVKSAEATVKTPLVPPVAGGLGAVVGAVPLPVAVGVTAEEVVEETPGAGA